MAHRDLVGAVVGGEAGEHGELGSGELGAELGRPEGAVGALGAADEVAGRAGEIQQVALRDTAHRWVGSGAHQAPVWRIRAGRLGRISRAGPG